MSHRGRCAALQVNGSTTPAPGCECSRACGSQVGSCLPHIHMKCAEKGAVLIYARHVQTARRQKGSGRLVQQHLHKRERQVCHARCVRICLLAYGMPLGPDCHPPPCSTLLPSLLPHPPSLHAHFRHKDITDGQWQCSFSTAMRDAVYACVQC